MKIKTGEKRIKNFQCFKTSYYLYVDNTLVLQTQFLPDIFDKLQIPRDKKNLLEFWEITADLARGINDCTHVEFTQKGKTYRIVEKFTEQPILKLELI